MRQAGVLAAEGIYALDNIAPKLHQDHANAQMLAKGEDQEHVFLLLLGWHLQQFLAFFNCPADLVSL